MGQRMLTRRAVDDMSSPIGDTLRVVVAESDAHFLSLHSSYLETEGCEVEVANTAALTLSRVASFKPHVLLLDARLPDMHAEDLIAKLGRRGYSLPVVLVVAGDNRPSVSTSLELGIYDYVVRESHPVYLKTIARALFAAFRSHQVDAENRHLLDLIQAQNLELAKLRRERSALSLADPEFGFYDRATFLHFLTKLIRHADRTFRPLTLIEVGLDCVDQIRDTFGDAFAADALRDVGRHMAHVFRASDTLAHLPEGNYAAVLPDTPAENAVHLIDRLRDSLREMSFFDGVTNQQVTISVGVCSYPSPDVDSAEEMLNAAGRLVGDVQREGGNCIRSTTGEIGGPITGIDIAGVQTVADEVRKGIEELNEHHRQAAQQLVDRIAQRYSADLSSERVVDLSVEIARRLGLPANQIEQIRVAAMLHDVGMVAVPRDVIDRPGPLDETDWRVIHRHPDWSVEICRPLAFLSDELTYIRHHHERFDGTGYPHKLKGATIPLGARILSCADALVAMTEPRAHRGPISVDGALAEIRSQAGRWFDPQVVDALAATVG